MKHGLLLVDTKYEFGKTSDGTLVLIDEVKCLLSEYVPSLNFFNVHVNIADQRLLNYTLLNQVGISSPVYTNSLTAFLYYRSILQIQAVIG